MHKIKTYDSLNNNLLNELESLEKEIFQENYRPGRLSTEALSKNNIFCLIAYEKDKAIGFKLGYKLKKDVFYSWMGGVLPSHRKQGLASAMMLEQHKAIKAAKYKYVRTNGRNQYKDMLVLNLKMGFEIIGTHLVREEGNLSISLEKKMT